MGDYEEKAKKPIYKKWWFWIIIVIVILIIILASGNNDTTIAENSTESTSESISESTSKSTETQVLSLGDTWTVDGQWSLTITSVESTTYRNEYSDKDPAQVIYITYTYENLGWEDEDEIWDGLYIDLETDAIITDSNSELGYSYPGDITTYPQETPVGSKCVGVQSCIGLNNESSSITLSISIYDANYEKQKVTYVLDVD